MRSRESAPRLETGCGDAAIRSIEERLHDMDKSECELDSWVRMHEEQVRPVRHNESLRSGSTHIAVVVSAAVLGRF